MNTRTPVDTTPPTHMIHGRMTLLLPRRGYSEYRERNNGGNVCIKQAQWAYSSKPHHGGCGVAEHTASAARVRRGYDCGEIAHVDIAAKYVTRNCAPNDRPSDVVEKGR